MAYITTPDWINAIQDVNLQQLINNNSAIQAASALLAIAEARSYLVQKFDVDAELAKTGTARDAQMVSTIIDIAIYHLHKRISPRNIPELRLTQYENAVAWLKMCAFGDVMPNLGRTTENLGNRIRMGGNVKNQNTY